MPPRPEPCNIEPTTEVTDLVAHLNNPECTDKNAALAKIQKRLAVWTSLRKGTDGNATLRVKRVSPRDLAMSCGSLPIDLHEPFDFSEIARHWGPEGTYSIRVYWTDKCIANLGFIQFPQLRRPSDMEPSNEGQNMERMPLEIPGDGNLQQILFQMFAFMTESQTKTNEAVMQQLKAQAQAIEKLAADRAGTTAEPEQPKSLLEQMEELAAAGKKVKDLTAAFAGLGGSTSGSERSQWVEFARDMVDEYGADTIAAGVGLVNKYIDSRSKSDDGSTEEVTGTIIELPKAD